MNNETVDYKTLVTYAKKSIKTPNTRLVKYDKETIKHKRELLDTLKAQYGHLLSVNTTLNIELLLVYIQMLQMKECNERQLITHGTNLSSESVKVRLKRYKKLSTEYKVMGIAVLQAQCELGGFYMKTTKRKTKTEYIKELITA